MSKNIFVINIHPSFSRKRIPLPTEVGRFLLAVLIELGSKLIVTDPCYKIGSEGQGVLESVNAGKYNCTALVLDEGQWGHRVAEIEAIHEDYSNVPEYRKEPFEVWVDSAMAGIFDYGQFKKLTENHDNLWTLMGEINAGLGNIIDDLGFVATSGYGDGNYPCYTCKDNGKIIAIKVVFI